MDDRGVDRADRYQLLVYQFVPRIEIQPDKVLFTRRFDVLQLFDGLGCVLDERQRRTRREFDVAEALRNGSFVYFHIVSMLDCS